MEVGLLLRGDRGQLDRGVHGGAPVRFPQRREHLCQRLDYQPEYRRGRGLELLGGARRLEQFCRGLGGLHCNLADPVLDVPHEDVYQGLSVSFRSRIMKSLACLMAALLTASVLPAAELRIGAATADITPDRPVPLTGDTTVRIAREILSRLTANVLALESRDGEQVVDQAILVVVRSVRDPAGNPGRIPQAPGRPVARLRPQQAVPGRHPHPRRAGAAAGPVRREGLRGRHAAQGVRALDVRADGRGGREGLGEPGRGGGRLGAGPCGRRPQSPRGVQRRHGQDARQHQRSRVPRHRGLRGPRRPGAVLLRRARSSSRRPPSPWPARPSARAAPRSAPTSGTTCGD